MSLGRSIGTNFNQQALRHLNTKQQQHSNDHTRYTAQSTAISDCATSHCAVINTATTRKRTVVTQVFWWLVEGKFGKRQESLAPRLFELILDGAENCSSGTNEDLCNDASWAMDAPGWSLALGITAVRFPSRCCRLRSALLLAVVSIGRLCWVVRSKQRLKICFLFRVVFLIPPAWSPFFVAVECTVVHNGCLMCLASQRRANSAPVATEKCACSIEATTHPHFTPNATADSPNPRCDDNTSCSSAPANTTVDLTATPDLNAHDRCSRTQRRPCCSG